MKEELLDAAKKYGNTVFLRSDQSCSVDEVFGFLKERTFNLGLGGSNIVLSSVGFVVRGYLPVLILPVSVAMSACEVLRNSICIPNLNIKIVAVGNTDMVDVEIMRLLPNMKIFESIREMFENYGPAYLRFPYKDAMI